MHFSTLLKATCLLSFSIDIAAGSYVLKDDYSPSSFFNMFDFFTGPDPTQGFVQYVDQGTAWNNGLIRNDGNRVYMGVDHTDVAPNGRRSVRLTSKNSYNHGLVILDLGHMPGGECGTWPAFWTVGPNWPYNGEIDIIEGVHQQSSNAMTLHTGPGCSITNDHAFSGNVNTWNCDVNAAGQAQNTGCGIGTPQTNTYGAGFNANNGGVYAMEWTSAAISVYFFPRGSIPSDISGGNPNPSAWGMPLARFQGGCDIDSNFRNQQIVFDITFCGSWAGNTWSSSSCASRASTCNAFVQNNPTAFADTYWSINSLRVYQGSSTPMNHVAQPGESADVPSAAVSSVAALSTIDVPSSTATPATFSLETKPTATYLDVSMFEPASTPSSIPASPPETAAASPPPTSHPFRPAKAGPLLESWFPNNGKDGGIPVARSIEGEEKVKARREAHLGGHKGRFFHRGGSRS